MKRLVLAVALSAALPFASTASAQVVAAAATSVGTPIATVAATLGLSIPVATAVVAIAGFTVVGGVVAVIDETSGTD